MLALTLTVTLNLGLFDLAKIPQCNVEAKAAGKNNNVLIGGDGSG